MSRRTVSFGLLVLTGLLASYHRHPVVRAVVRDYDKEELNDTDEHVEEQDERFRRKVFCAGQRARPLSTDLDRQSR